MMGALPPVVPQDQLSGPSRLKPAAALPTHRRAVQSPRRRDPHSYNLQDNFFRGDVRDVFS